MTTTIGLSPSYYFGNNIDVVQNVSCHFEQSEKSRRVPWQSSCQRAKCKLVYNLSASAAELNGKHKVPARDPSAAMLCQDDTIVGDLEYRTTAILSPKQVPTDNTNEHGFYCQQNLTEINH